MEQKEKADMLAKLDDLKQDVINDKVDTLVWSVKSEDGVRSFVNGDAIMAYGLTQMINQNINEKVQRIHKQNKYADLLSMFAGDSDED